MSEAKIVLTAVDQTKAALESAKRNIASIGDTVTRATSLMGPMAAGVLSVAGAVTLLSKALDTMDQLDEMSEKTGVSVEALSKLRFAGESVGTTTEQLGGGMRKLVGLAHNKAVKGKAGIQRGAGQVIVCPRPTLGKLGTRLHRGRYIARCRSTGGRHKKLKPRDFLARGIQMLENVIREIPRHPVAKKAGGNFKAGQGPTQLRKTNRFNPSCVVVAANALDQVFAQLAPGLVCHSSSVPGLSG